MIQFFQTIMGKAFYESHVPKIANALVKIADQLEQINKELEATRKREEEKSAPAIERCMYCELHNCECEFDENGRPYLTCLDCNKSIGKGCQC